MPVRIWSATPLKGKTDFFAGAVVNPGVSGATLDMQIMKNGKGKLKPGRNSSRPRYLRTGKIRQIHEARRRPRRAGPRGVIPPEIRRYG